MAPPREPNLDELETQSADLFDWRLVRDATGFVLRGIRRHLRLAGATFVACAVLSVAGALLMPKSYRVQTKILAQRNLVMATLGNPHRAVPYDADAPTRAAYETVLNRDNLVNLIKQTNLVDQWEATRAPILRVKDVIMDTLRGKMDDEDKLEAMVGLLEKRLFVQTGEGTVTIGINWPDARLAYQLVEAAQQNFLETRHVSEVSAIAESISILEMHASTVNESIQQALTEVQRLHDQRRAPKSAAAKDPPPAPAPKPAAQARSGVNEQELSQLKFLIRSKRRSISDLEDARSRQLTELNAQLTEQRVIYSDQHPNIVALRQRIAALQKDSPQITALKHDEEALLAEYATKGGRDPESMVEPRSGGGQTSNARARAETELSAPEPSPGEDPALEHARSQLRMANAKYEDLLMRIDAARIELDTARAAFKYRYSVVNPAQLPKKPQKPNVPVLIGGGLFASLLLALFIGAAKDLFDGRIVEPWQIERTLGVPVLGQVPPQ